MLSCWLDGFALRGESWCVMLRINPDEGHTANKTLVSDIVLTVVYQTDRLVESKLFPISAILVASRQCDHLDRLKTDCGCAKDGAGICRRLLDQVSRVQVMYSCIPTYVSQVYRLQWRGMLLGEKEEHESYVGLEGWQVQALALRLHGSRTRRHLRLGKRVTMHKGGGGYPGIFCDWSQWPREPEGLMEFSEPSASPSSSYTCRE